MADNSSTNPQNLPSFQAKKTKDTGSSAPDVTEHDIGTGNDTQAANLEDQQQNADWLKRRDFSNAEKRQIAPKAVEPKEDHAEVKASVDIRSKTAQPTPMDGDERAVLEQQAKTMVNQLDSAGVGKKVPPPNYGRKGSMKTAVGLLGVLVLGLGMVVGMKLLGTDQAGDIRRSAVSLDPHGQEFCSRAEVANGNCCFRISSAEVNDCVSGDPYINAQIRIYKYTCPGTDNTPSGCNDNGVRIGTNEGTYCINDENYCGTTQIDWGCFSDLGSSTGGGITANTWTSSCGPEPTIPPPTNTPPGPSNTPPPTPTNTPRPTPTPTPTPTPVPLACYSLTHTPAFPVLGDDVTFACAATGQFINHYEFQYAINGGGYVGLDEASPASGVSVSLKVDQAGDYVARCRACRSQDGSDCTTYETEALQIYSR